MTKIGTGDRKVRPKHFLLQVYRAHHNSNEAHSVSLDKNRGEKGCALQKHIIGHRNNSAIPRSYSANDRTTRPHNNNTDNTNGQARQSRSTQERSTCLLNRVEYGKQQRALSQPRCRGNYFNNFKDNVIELETNGRHSPIRISRGKRRDRSSPRVQQVTEFSDDEHSAYKDDRSVQQTWHNRLAKAPDELFQTLSQYQSETEEEDEEEEELSESSADWKADSMRYSRSRSKYSGKEEISNGTSDDPDLDIENVNLCRHNITDPFDANNSMKKSGKTKGQKKDPYTLKEKSGKKKASGFRAFASNKKDATQLKIQAKHLEHAKESIERKYESLQKQYNLISSQYHTMKTQNETLMAENLEGRNLQVLNQLMEKKLDDLRKHLASKEGSEIDKDRRIMTLENEVYNLRQHTAGMEVTVNHLKRELADREEQLSTLITFQKLEQEKDLVMKMMHNELVELKGNIRVLARFKPDEDDIFTYISNDTVQIKPVRLADIEALGSKKKVFSFNKIFRPASSQEDIYEEVSPFVTSCVDGYNVSVLTYGQTGSGKTFTIEGDRNRNGILARACHQILSLTRNRAMWKFCVRISIVEIYNEQVSDLMTSALHPVNIQDDGRCVLVKGLQEQSILTEEDVMRFVKLGRSRRATARTGGNQDSSRSHFIVMIRIKGKNALQGTLTHGVLTLCDLAGFEKFTEDDPYSAIATESKYIAKSLNALSRVLESLHKKSKSIPYRDSKLTHLLKPSLSGDAKCVLILTVSTARENMDASLRTLNFGIQAVQISLGGARKNVACLTNESIEVQKAKQVKAKNASKLKSFKV